MPRCALTLPSRIRWCKKRSQQQQQQQQQQLRRWSGSRQPRCRPGPSARVMWRMLPSGRSTRQHSGRHPQRARTESRPPQCWSRGCCRTVQQGPSGHLSGGLPPSTSLATFADTQGAHPLTRTATVLVFWPCLSRQAACQLPPRTCTAIEPASVAARSAGIRHETVPCNKRCNRMMCRCRVPVTGGTR